MKSGEEILNFRKDILQLWKKIYQLNPFSEEAEKDYLLYASGNSCIIVKPLISESPLIDTGFAIPASIYLMLSSREFRSMGTRTALPSVFISKTSLVLSSCRPVRTERISRFDGTGGTETSQPPARSSTILSGFFNVK